LVAFPETRLLRALVPRYTLTAAQRKRGAADHAGRPSLVGPVL